MTTRQPTLIDEIASLYGDPADPALAAAGINRPSIEDLQVVFVEAMRLGLHDISLVFGAEINRLQSAPDAYSNLLASTAGIWRIH